MDALLTGMRRIWSVRRYCNMSRGIGNYDLTEFQTVSDGNMLNCKIKIDVIHFFVIMNNKYTVITMVPRGIFVWFTQWSLHKIFSLYFFYDRFIIRPWTLSKPARDQSLDPLGMILTNELSFICLSSQGLMLHEIRYYSICRATAWGLRALYSFADNPPNILRG